jgi:hypothetical protein
MTSTCMQYVYMRCLLIDRLRNLEPRVLNDELPEQILQTASEPKRRKQVFLLYHWNLTYIRD